MYESGDGLRLLEQTVSLSQSGIRKILTSARVYKGEGEGNRRHKAGGWGKQKPMQARIEAMSKSKRTASKQIRKDLFDKRIGAGMSQQQIADLLGFSKPYYNGIENARETPSEEMWSKIGSLFGLREADSSDIRPVSEVLSAKPDKKVRRKKATVVSNTPKESNIMSTDDDDDTGFYSSYNTPGLLDKNDIKKAKQ